MGVPRVFFVSGQDLNHLRLPKTHKEHAPNQSGSEPLSRDNEDARHEVEIEKGSTEVRSTSGTQSANVQAFGL